MIRAFSIVLLLVYFSALSGWSVNIHYCGVQITDLSLFDSIEEKKCCCNAMKGKCKSCADIKFVTKLHDAHTGHSKLISSSLLTINKFIVPEFRVFKFSFLIIQSSSSIQSHSPPRLADIVIYLRNMTFLI